jgi:hypothetical protein
MIRKILLTEYIGAIVVAVLVADAVSAVVTTAVGQVYWRLQLKDNPSLASHRFSMTYTLLDALSKIVLYLISAYLLARWLYPRANSPQVHPHQGNEPCR